MKKTVCFVALWICVAALSLCGCREDGQAEAAENQVWETMPQLTYGVMETQKLEVLPWYDGRTEAASQCTMAETELGYYWSLGGNLFYADKANLGNWVVVCNQPDCRHSPNWTRGQVVCNGKIGMRFLLRGGRIVFEEDSGHHPEIYNNQSKFGMILVSREADGTDLRLEYALEDAMVGNSGGMLSSQLTSTQYILNTSSMQSDGSYRNVLYRVTKAGARMIRESVTEEEQGIYMVRVLHGDEAFKMGNVISAESGCYRFVGDSAEPVAAAQESGYLSGNTLRVFRTDEGYFDVNLNTGETVRLSNARFHNSTAEILLPNCIIETTLNSEDGESSHTIHQMAVFDGSQWLHIELPAELENAETGTCVQNFAVTSDAIFFTVSTNGRDFYRYGGPIYRISLNREILVAELCQELQMPQ